MDQHQDQFTNVKLCPFRVFLHLFQSLLCVKSANFDDKRNTRQQPTPPNVQVESMTSSQAPCTAPKRESETVDHSSANASERVSGLGGSTADSSGASPRPFPRGWGGQ